MPAMKDCENPFLILKPLILSPMVFFDGISCISNVNLVAL